MTSISEQNARAHRIATQTSVDIICNNAGDEEDANGIKWKLLTARVAADLGEWIVYLMGRGLAIKKRSPGGYVYIRFLVPGFCRHCGCSYDKPCDPPCGWANHSQTCCDNPICTRKEIRSVKGK